MVNVAGTVAVAMGTAARSLSMCRLPDDPPTTNACIGFIIENPTGTGSFVGGTSALDDATIVPNVVYVNSDLGFQRQPLRPLVSSAPCCIDPAGRGENPFHSRSHIFKTSQTLTSLCISVKKQKKNWITQVP